jgi:hypothetical protein
MNRGARENTALKFLFYQGSDSLPGVLVGMFRVNKIIMTGWLEGSIKVTALSIRNKSRNHETRQ